jgi:adenylate cyclase class 2
MNTEIEAKWLDLDHDEIRAKLQKLGAKQVREKTDMTRAVFDLPKPSLNEWVRVRDEGNQITMSYKIHDDSSLTGTREICLTVDNFANAVDFLRALGLSQKAFQETRRETWSLDGAEIDLDEWPWLPPFIEIEAESTEQVENIARKLGLAMNDSVSGAADAVYAKYYQVDTNDVNQWPEIKFGPVPDWLEKVRRK